MGGLTTAERAMAGRCIFVRKNTIDSIQYALCSAERNIHRHITPFFLRLRDTLFEISIHFGKGINIGTLEREDRLLFITHDK